jgi:hypothetical protein
MQQRLPGDRPGPPYEGCPTGPGISTRQRILAAQLRHAARVKHHASSPAAGGEIAYC